MPKLLAPVTAVLVLLVGCGGGDDEPASPGGGPQTTVPSAEQDKQLAGRIVLTAADLPGYREDTSPEGDDEGIERAFAVCVQNDPVLTATEPEHPRTVEGKDFDRAGQQSVSSKVTVAETEAQAQAALAQLRNQTVLDCLEGAVRRELPASLDPGVSVENVSVSTLPVATVGDETVGVRIAVTVAAEGETARVISDVTIIRGGRAVAFLSTNGVGTPFSNSERDALAMKMAERMP